MNAVKLLALASLLLAPVLGACTHPARLETPSGFATLEPSSAFSYRAANARGVVVSARSEPNALAGNLDFWADSIDQHLTRAGYAQKLVKDVEGRGGLRGRQLRYSADRGGREHRYWVTVFLVKDRVVLVEAGGDAEPFSKAEASVERAISTVVVN